MDKTKAIIAGAGLLLAGAISAPLLIGDAAAYEPDAAKCAVIVRVHGGTCAEHLDAALERMADRARAQERATRAAGVELLDAADIEALDAKIRVKKDALKAEEQEPE